MSQEQRDINTYRDASAFSVAASQWYQAPLRTKKFASKGLDSEELLAVLRNLCHFVPQRHSELYKDVMKAMLLPLLKLLRNENLVEQLVNDQDLKPFLPTMLSALGHMAQKRISPSAWGSHVSFAPSFVE